MQSPPGQIPLICAIVGRERLLRTEALAGVLEPFTDSLDPLGPVRVDGSGAELAAVLDDVRTASLLGHRVVVVDDADAFISAHRKALERYCQQPAPGGTLVFLCNSLPKNTRLCRIISEQGTVRVCDAPKGRALSAWIVERAQRVHGKRIIPQAAQILRERAGDAIGRLDSELAKLSTYVGERDNITPADVNALTGQHREEKVFAVIDAISSGKSSEALHHWEQVLATDRSAPARAVAGLAWGVRRLLEARRDWERGASLHELARRFYTDPDTLKRRLQRAPIARLEAQQRDLLAADLAVKTGVSTVENAVERFIVQHAATSS